MLHFIGFIIAVWLLAALWAAHPKAVLYLIAAPFVMITLAVIVAIANKPVETKTVKWVPPPGFFADDEEEPASAPVIVKHHNKHNNNHNNHNHNKQ